jgi:type I restriction enzyme M protein
MQGQFRTPRHIIDFLVAIVDPDKGETILDPACGTAGFLISAYKHILLKYTKANQKDIQSPKMGVSTVYNIFSYNQLAVKPFNNLGDALNPRRPQKADSEFCRL